MPDFETIVKLLVMALAAIGIPIGAYAAFAATRAIWVKPRGEASGLAQEMDLLRERLTELEAQQGRMAELEERLDFAERLLLQSRQDQRLAPGPGESR